jgi:hypothetical protein
VKLKFGQVSFFVTCPNGQVAKKVNVEPWLVPTQLLAGYETFEKDISEIDKIIVQDTVIL